MAACYQFALSNPVVGKEAEFHEWYGAHHLYTGVMTPGILAGQRFQRVPGPWPSGRHDFLALWELDNPPYALDQLARVKGTSRMPLSDAVDMAGIQPPTMWVRASVRNRQRIVVDTATRGTCVLLLANARNNADNSFERALMTGGLSDLIDQPGVVAGDLLTLADEQIRNNARKFRFAMLIELSDAPAGVEALRNRLPALPYLDGEKWQATVFRPLGERVDTAGARLKFAEDRAESQQTVMSATASTTIWN